MASSTGIGRYCSAMRKLVSGLLLVSGEMERWLEVPLHQGEAARRAVLEGDETGAMERFAQCRARRVGERRPCFGTEGLAILCSLALCGVYSPTHLTDKRSLV